MLSVRDVMTTPVITVTPTMPLREVARVLIDHRVSGVPVTDDSGAVVGVVSEADFLVKEQGLDAVRHRPLARVLGESAETRAQLARLTARTAAEAMSSPAITVGPWLRIAEAAQLMTQRRVNRLPVVDDRGLLVGIVTRADLVRAYVRTDDQLARTIRDEVLARNLLLDPTTFQVVVTDGVASVSGSVERRSTAEMIAHAVATVPGLVEARTDVSWWRDDSRNDHVVTDPVFP
jgi:CBS domain-containing protein